jgi:hypothetical protein
MNNKVLENQTNPTNVIDGLLEMNDTNTRQWVKVKEGRLWIDDQPLDSLVGRINALNPYSMKWVNGQPSKTEWSPGQQPPEGYREAIDLLLVNEEGEFGLSVSNMTGIRNLCKYIQELKRSNQTIDQVDTEIRLQLFQNQYRSYHAVVFSQYESTSPESEENEFDMYF